MQFDPGQLLMLLQWMDSAFPTGSFAHSGGLETYAQAGVVQTADDLAHLIAVKLENATSTDLIIIHTAMSAYQANDRPKIRHLDNLCSASKPARETRESSEKIGKRMLSSVLNLVDDEILLFYQNTISEGNCAGHHAVTHGLACMALGIEPHAAMLAFGYGLAANQIAASLKLLRIGQTQAQSVLSEAGEVIAAAVEAALARTLDDFGGFTPGLDIRAMQHEYLFRRLFIS
ncbi:MAG: urease accessory protein UreF [Anaerolineae bacterium]|nr:urease accessory protein UreF [Anaerolineae bacterium]